MGKLLALVLVLVAVAAIGGLLYRPGTVIGVSGKSLAYSLRGEADVDETGICVEAQGDEDRFICGVRAGREGSSVAYEVVTKDAGCWDASRQGAGNAPSALSGCITIVDLIRPD
jgi:hypothetical protein